MVVRIGLLLVGIALGSVVGYQIAGGKNGRSEGALAELDRLQAAAIGGAVGAVAGVVTGGVRRNRRSP